MTATFQTFYIELLAVIMVLALGLSPFHRQRLACRALVFVYEIGMSCHLRLLRLKFAPRFITLKSRLLCLHIQIRCLNARMTVRKYVRHQFRSVQGRLQTSSANRMSAL